MAIRDRIWNSAVIIGGILEIFLIMCLIGELNGWHNPMSALFG